jgi:Zn-finger nucleic acid-binding protein
MMLAYGTIFWAGMVATIGYAIVGLGMGLDDLARLREARAWGLFWLSAPAIVLLGAQAGWAWSGRQRAALLTAAHGACPSCRASLLGQSEDEDGLVRCGACHAHWKLGTPACCPTCGYDLSGAADAVGVATCPECASRWPSAAPHRERHEAIVLHGAIRDDAGHEMPHRSDPKAHRKVRRTRSPAELERAGLRGWFQSWGFVLAFLFLPGGVALLAAWLADRFSSPGVARVLTMVLIYGGLAVMAIAIPRALRKTAMQSSRRLSICPACDADMRGISVTDNGLTRCPDCAAQWRLLPQPTD